MDVPLFSVVVKPLKMKAIKEKSGKNRIFFRPLKFMNELFMRLRRGDYLLINAGYESKKVCLPRS